MSHVDRACARTKRIYNIYMNNGRTWNQSRGYWPHLTDEEIAAPNFIPEMLAHQTRYCRGDRRDWSRRVLARLSA